MENFRPALYCTHCRQETLFEQVEPGRYSCTHCRQVAMVLPDPMDAAGRNNAPREGGALWR